MLAVPLALPGSATSVSRHATVTTVPRTQLVADRVSSHALAPAAHHATTTRAPHARATHTTATMTAAQRYQAWRRHVAYVAWRHHVAYAHWRAAVAAARQGRTARYLAWRRAVAAAAAARRATVRTTATLHAPTTVHGVRVGVATWYSWHPGQCATSYRPRGTRIWITDLATGRVITCLVTDAQPYSPERVVDLNETQFAQLAPLSQGVVRVRVTW
jgi:rare lipoprotein A (peptidoglycan hydrolase)